MKGEGTMEKNYFSIVMEERSYLMASLESTFANHRMETAIMKLEDVERAVSQQELSGIMLCTCDSLLEQLDEVKAIVDMSVRAKIPIFIMGNIEEVEALWSIIPRQLINAVYIRPIVMNEVVDDICERLAELARARKKIILTVDDSGVTLRNIKGLLEDKYQVILANTGTTAIKYLTLNKPDLILLDYEMPIADGKQIMQMIREDAEFQDIPIIFLTGKNDTETVMKVMKLKPDGYLLKDMGPKQLHVAIDNFFRQRAAG